MSFKFNVRGLRTQRVRADHAALAQVKERLAHLTRDQVAADALLAEAKRAADDIARETRELRDVERNMEAKLELSRAALVQECLSTLPDDVLRCIFLEAVSSGGAHTPFALAAVCRRWRKVALTHSSVWSDIRVLAPRFCAAGSSRHRQITAEYHRAQWLLNRSRSAPLTISISSNDFYGDAGACKTFVRLLELVGTHVSRWQSAVLCLPKELNRSPLQFLKGPTPLLVSLRISGPLANGSLGPDEGGYLPFAPHLESLDISNVGLGCSGRYKYPVLKTLSLGDGACAEKDLYNYLRMGAHSTEKLVLGCQLTSDRTGAALSFPRLKHLVIQRVSMASVSIRLPSLFTASALGHLELDVTTWREGEAIAPFLDTVSSTVRKLTLVALLGPTLTGGSLSVFARLRRVEELVFRGMVPGCIHNDALDLLTTRNPPVWPNLARIKNVRYAGGRVWSSEAIFRFIESRNTPTEQDTESARTCKLVEFTFNKVSPAWLVAEVDRLLKL